jgi:hypothetical protein
MEYEIPGNVRIKKNSRRLFKQDKRIMNLPSKAYMVWEKEAREYLIYKYLPHSWGHESDLLHVKALFYYKGAKPDLSGLLESVGDAFEGILWEDDKQIVSWDGSRSYHDKENPRLILTVEEYKEVKV